jgi:hypothetical protein
MQTRQSGIHTELIKIMLYAFRRCRRKEAEKRYDEIRMEDVVTVCVRIDGTNRKWILHQVVEMTAWKELKGQAHSACLD